MTNKYFSFIPILVLVMLMITGCCKKEPQLLVNEADISDNAICDSVVSENTTTVFVHISGAVNEPGVYELSRESRLYDAVNEAGGFCSNACTDYCNLAMLLEDGTQYFIPTNEEAIVLRCTDNSGDVLSHYGSDGRLNINLATREELLQLSGIGESRADSILKYREENGAFSKPEDIMKVSGIKEALFSQIENSIMTE